MALISYREGSFGMLDSLSPFVRLAWDNIIYPPWNLKERVIFDFELLFIKEGEILVNIEEQDYHGIPGDVFLFKPRLKHSINFLSGEKFHQPHIHFDFVYQQNSPEITVSFRSLHEISESEMTLFREDIFSALPLEIPNHFRLNNFILLEKMFMDIINEFELKMPFYEINLKGMFLQLWTYLLRENYWEINQNKIPDIDKLIKIRDFLNHYPPNEKVNLDQLSEIAHLSKYHLVRIFTKAFGVSPIKYHQMVRIKKAKELIQFTNESITLVAERLGFESIHSFTRAFKINEKVTPSFYRKKNNGPFLDK
jgi:AraC-like DNA-binding protein